MPRVDNSAKTPLAFSLDKFVSKRAADEISRLGKAYPCHVTAVNGSIVTVAFDVTGPLQLPSVTVPVFGPEYVRYPIQVGCKGVCFPCDAYIGAVTGLGGSSTNFAQPGNLAALVFFPVANVNWFPVNGNYLVLYGPNGVTLTDAAQDISFTLSPTGIVLTMPDSASFTIGNVTITNNDVVVNGVSLMSHVHGGVTAGSDDTGAPVS